MRTSTKRSIQEVINDGRLARQANIDKFEVSDKVKFILRKAGHLASEGKETRKGSIDKFVNNKLEQVEVKLEPVNKNKRSDDLRINYFNVGEAIVLGLSILSAVVFAVLIIGNK